MYVVQTIKTRIHMTGQYAENIPESRITTVLKETKERALVSMDAACMLFEYECDGDCPKITTRLLDTETAKVSVSIRFFETFELIEELRVTIMKW